MLQTYRAIQPLAPHCVSTSGFSLIRVARRDATGSTSPSFGLLLLIRECLAAARLWGAEVFHTKVVDRLGDPAEVTIGLFARRKLRIVRIHT